MHLVENITKQELNNIKQIIGNAFVNNELFHEFGHNRQELVQKYMNHYVQYVYDSKSLYVNDTNDGYIGLCYSKNEPLIPKIKMLVGIMKDIPTIKLMNMLKQANENTKGNNIYTKNPYLEVLMVCVDKKVQGQGKSRELVEFAKSEAINYNVPLLFDTDVETYAKIYQHYGCTLYNQCTASNGVTRYNLVYQYKGDQYD